jgi:hypothetical protein
MDKIELCMKLSITYMCSITYCICKMIIVKLVGIQLVCSQNFQLASALLLFFTSQLRSVVDFDCLKRNYHNKRTTGPGSFKTLNELVVFMKELRMRIIVFMVSYLIFQKN